MKEKFTLISISELKLNVEACLIYIKEELLKETYTDLLLSQPKIENNKIVINILYDEIPQFCSEAATDKDCYNRPLYKEMTENIDIAYKSVNSELNRDENEDVTKEDAWNVNVILHLKSFLENLQNKLNHN